MIALLPKVYKDLLINYNGFIYWGYYEGNDIFRVGTSLDGRNDIRVNSEQIKDWQYYTFNLEENYG